MVLVALMVMTALQAKIVTFDFTNPAGLGITPSKTKSTGVNLSGTPYTVDGVTCTFVKVNKNNDSKLFTKSDSVSYELRTYADNTITFTAEEDITQIVAHGDAYPFKEMNEGVWLGTAKSVTLTAGSGTTKVTSFEITVGEEAVVWKPDTLSVSEAIQKIKDNDPIIKNTHYVKGIVAEMPFLAGVSYYCTYLRDVDNVTDSIEAFDFTKDANTKFTSIEEMQEQMSLGDTVLVFAKSLEYYATDGIYELKCGYLSKMEGKTSMVNLTSTYKYGFGAIAKDPVESSFPYEVILSKADAEDYEDALHFTINSSKEKGIAGTYTFGDESYIDNKEGTTPISGTLKLKFSEENGNYNLYELVATFMMAGNVYRIDSTYSLQGWYSDLSEPFALTDDVPFVPTDDQEITCAQAQEYALHVLADGATSGIPVYVIGYANNVQDPSGTQQTFYLDDVQGGKKVVQSYYGNLPAGKKVVNGTKVRLYGNLMHYVKGSDHTAEIKNGTVEILEGGEDLPREITLEEVPAGAITVAEAVEIAKALNMPAPTGTSDTSDVVVVYGYLTKIDKNGDYSSKFKNESFFMDDVPAQPDKFYDFSAYRCSLEAAAIVGDQIFVEGRLIKYVGGDYTKYQIIEGKGHFVALSTALHEIAAKMPSAQVKKVLYRGKLYIMRAGAVYDVNGNKMK